MTEDDSRITRALVSALERVLEPVVRMALRYGFTYAAFDETTRRIFLRVARTDFTIPGRKLSDSRIAVLTGLSRRDVARLKKEEQAPDRSDEDRINRAARVIAAWRREEEFKDGAGRPRTLAVDGEDHCFEQLVKRFAGDVPIRATLDELIRIGAVEKTAEGRLRLIARAYVPATAQADTIAVLGSHVPDLLRSIDHNMTCKPGEGFFQRRVVYDNVPQEHAEGLRHTVAEHGQKLLETLDAELSRHDRDANPAVEGTGRVRLSLGVYYVEHDFDED
jgi:hypothetical protein